MRANDAECGEIPILLVDDDEIFRESLAENLRADGHEVESYGSLAGAIEAIRDREFALLITDYSLPDGNGVELVDHFYERQKHPTVIVTAYLTPILSSHVKIRDHLSLLLKPVDYRNLHTLLHRVRDRPA